MRDPSVINSKVLNVIHALGSSVGSPKRSRKMDWVRVSSWARAARRLARNASARSSTSAIRRCSASGGSGTRICLQHVDRDSALQSRSEPLENFA